MIIQDSAKSKSNIVDLTEIQRYVRHSMTLGTPIYANVGYRLCWAGEETSYDEVLMVNNILDNLLSLLSEREGGLVCILERGDLVYL
jgi:hypothetical protein